MKNRTMDRQPARGRRIREFLTGRVNRGVLFRLALVLLVIGLGATLAVESRGNATRDLHWSNPQWGLPMNLPDSSNFFMLTPEVYRSAQPTAEALRAYEKLGIKTVINLRGEHSDRDLIRGTDLTLVEVPMRSDIIPDDKVIAVLKVMKDEPGPFLVHCQHGANRTGVILAMYRMVFENWSREQALDEMINGGYGFHRGNEAIIKYIQTVDLNKIRSALAS